MTTNRPLRVFICHSSQDKPAVRELYQKLRAEPWIEPWLDEEELFPGMDWNIEIEKAIEETDVIVVCLSKSSTTKEGYVQKEIRTALDYADYKPEGTLFIIPVRLEECTPPKRLGRWQYADYFEGQRERAFERLLVSLRRQSNSLGFKSEQSTPEEKKPLIKTPLLKKEEVQTEEKKLLVKTPHPAGRANPITPAMPKQNQAASLIYKTVEVDKMKVFVAFPFKQVFFVLYETVIKPTAVAHNLSCCIMQDRGLADNAIDITMASSGLIIADITEQDPKVLYEIGIAIGLSKELVLLTSNINDLPSNMLNFRFLLYDISERAVLSKELGRFFDEYISSIQD